MAIRKNKSGTYTVDVYDKSGNRIVRVIQKNSDARNLEAKINNDKLERKLINKGLKPERTEFHAAIEEARLSKSSLRPKSKQKYNAVLDQIEIFVDNKNIRYIDQFTPEHANQLYYELIKERKIIRGKKEKNIKAKPNTINFYLQTYRAIFKTELAKGRIARDPMTHIKDLKVERKKPDYYTDEELKGFFEQEMDEGYRNVFLALLHTGMRIDELANLAWHDVDLKKRLITVSTKVDFSPKTDSSQRIIPMNTVMYNMIGRMSLNKQNQKYVIASVKGGKLRERHLLIICKRIAAKAGIKSNAYLHKFRHTFATHLIQHGVPIERIQKLLGHTDIRQTLVYAYVRTDDMHSDLELLNSLTHPLRGVVAK